MSSIAEIARELVKRKPFLEDALTRGIINYNALAEELLPQIQEMAGSKEVKLTTVSMALRRLGEQLNAKHVVQIEKKLRDFVSSDMIIKYDLFEITVRLVPNINLASSLSKIYELIPVTSKSFLSVTQGSMEATIITHIHYKSQILEILKQFEIISIIDDLAALVIRIPENSTEVPGLFYYFTKALSMDGISIIELISTFSEMQFIVDEDDVPNASKTIRRLLKKVEIDQ